MERLGYRPNYAARVLKSGRFNSIGIVLFDILSFGNAHILNGITSTASKYGYATTIHYFGQGDDRTLQAAARRMKELPVDGVIMILEEKVNDFDTFTPPKDMPVVLISEDPSDSCPTIDADHYGCSTAIVDYLLNRGHKTVYHVAGPSSSRAAESRARGWRDALTQFGIAIPSTYLGDWEADSGYQAGLALARDPACTAVYASNDQMACGVIAGLAAGGKSVPDDVSVVGVDDSLEGIIPRLGLTTMRVKFEDIGRESFYMLMRMLKGEHVPVGVKTVIPGELIERHSVKAIGE